LKTELASIEFPIKASDMLHEAMADGCKDAEDVHYWIAGKHKELPHPFKID
jgi:hypothetical protein